jgi:hypothetical protein
MQQFPRGAFWCAYLPSSHSRAHRAAYYTRDSRNDSRSVKFTRAIASRSCSASLFPLQIHSAEYYMERENVVALSRTRPSISRAGGQRPENEKDWDVQPPFVPLLIKLAKHVFANSNEQIICRHYRTRARRGHEYFSQSTSSSVRIVLDVGQLIKTPARLEVNSVTASHREHSLCQNY